MANQRPPQQPMYKRAAGPAPVAARPQPQPAGARVAASPRAGTSATPAPKTALPRAGAALAAATPPPAAQRPPADPVLDSLIRTIVGLEAIVEEETAALNQRQAIDLDTFSNRKSQSLMELNRSMKHIDPPRHTTQLAPRLDSLRRKLAANQAALKLHLEAVREISGIIANAIREQDSDGTYSQTIRRPEAAYGYD